MESMVSLISTVENNIKELEDAEKKTAKALAALEQELDDIRKNLGMFRKTLENLTSIRDGEIQVVLAEKPVEIKEEKKVETKVPINKKPVGNRAEPLCAIDEKGEKIAMYESRTQAAIDLNISQATMTRRLKMDEAVQIKRYGYALKDIKKKA